MTGLLLPALATLPPPGMGAPRPSREGLVTGADIAFSAIFGELVQSFPEAPPEPLAEGAFAKDVILPENPSDLPVTMADAALPEAIEGLLVPLPSSDEKTLGPTRTAVPADPAGLVTGDWGANLLRFRLDVASGGADRGVEVRLISAAPAGDADLAMPFATAAPGDIQRRVQDLVGRNAIAEHLSVPTPGPHEMNDRVLSPRITGPLAVLRSSTGSSKDLQLPAVDVAAGGGGLLPDVAVGSSDLIHATLPHELRHASAETLKLHRATDAPPPTERQIVAAITAAPSGRTEILLDPQELGRMRLSFEGDETALVLTLHADRSETADLLRRSAEMLAQEFRAAGYENLSFVFTDQRDSQNDAPRSAEDDTYPHAPAEIVAEFSPRRTVCGSLDLRL